jgi:hypothetical protein
MSLSIVLLYIVVAVLIFILAKISDIRTFSALVLSLLVAQIVMSIFRPDVKSSTSKEMNVHLVAQVVTSVIILVYVFGKALSDRSC